MLNRDQAFNFGIDVCPKCGGCGYILSSANEAEKCPVCGGVLHSQENTGIPKHFFGVSLSQFGFDSYSQKVGKLETLAKTFVEQFPKWKEAGKGLFLWGMPGNGKTRLSCILANEIAEKYHLKVRFVAVPDYIKIYGDSMKRQPGEVDKSEIYRACDVLIFDDLGAEKSSEWNEQLIFEIINKRLETKKITLFTSNLSPEALGYNQRIIDRVLKMSVVLEMPPESIRLKIAEKEQENFLKSILG